MSGHTPLPDALRRALEADHRPVHALRPAPVRALWVALWAALALVVLPLLIGIRGDVAGLGLALSWGAAALECLAGIGLVVLALRESVPGCGITTPRAAAAVGTGVGLQVLVAVLCWLRCGVPFGAFPPAGAHCFTDEGLLALPALALTMLLVLRAYAVRPRWAGDLGGAGAGLLTDGVWHLICPHAELSHVLVWHTGAVLTLAAAGWVLGVGIEALQRRSTAR